MHLAQPVHAEFEGLRQSEIRRMRHAARGSPDRMTILLHLSGSGTFGDRMKITVGKELKMSGLSARGDFLKNNVRVVRTSGQSHSFPGFLS
jgi:hypothetical protein